MNRIVFRARARLDVLEQYDWYVAELAHAAAIGFLDAVEDTTSLLLGAPEIGRSEEYQHSLLNGIRSIGVSGYPSIRLYYRADGDGIDVIRVLHVARDAVRIFESE